MDTQQPELSPTTLAIADACFQSARSILKIMTFLWVDGSIATYGYFDSHYLFSASLIFLLATINYPNTQGVDRTSFDVARNLLRNLANAGNIAAKECYDQLLQVKARMSEFEQPVVGGENVVLEGGGPVAALPLDDRIISEFLEQGFADLDWGINMDAMFLGR